MTGERCATGRPATNRRALLAMLCAALAATVVMLAPNAASAQCAYMLANFCTGPSYPLPPTNGNNSQASSLLATLDIGSIFLQRLGRNSTFAGNAAANSNPGGGGAPASDQPRYRTWSEIYGLTSDTDAQGSFVGDKRQTVGGVGGLGVTLAPGLNVGVSVDQSHTRISVPAALQKGSLNLTQIGVNATYEVGPWTFAVAGIHGFADISSSRVATFGVFNLGTAAAKYDGSISGGLFEVNYYWGFDQWRIVPKLAAEYTYSRTDAYQEIGSLLPVAAGAATGERARVLIGAEVGRYWIFNQHVLDISGYAKFIDNFHQRIDSVAVTSIGGSITVAGVRESDTGVDAGGMVSFGLTNTARVYLAYDGKFRDGFTSHHGTAGLEVRW